MNWESLLVNCRLILITVHLTLPFKYPLQIQIRFNGKFFWNQIKLEKFSVRIKL